jgi:fructose-bisphosphate aldolase class II
MSLVSGREVLREAQAGGYAIGAFNFNNMEVLQGIVAAAEAERSPVFLAASEGAIAYAGLPFITAMARIAAAGTSVPLVLHLDHGRDLALIQSCIDAGFTSVMIDASHLPFEENLRQTRQVVDMARLRSVSVEAELGKLKGVEDIVSVLERDAVLVDPVQAERFVRESGVDSLAPAIGTAHGAFKFKGEPRLDFDRLRQVRDRTGIPLVLHGASSVPADVLNWAVRFGARLEHAQGVPMAAIQEAIANGIGKVNVDTDLRLALAGSVRQTLAEHPEEFDPRKILGPARDAVREVVQGKIRAFRLKK